MRSNATRKQFKRLRANRTARYKTKRRAVRNKRITFKNKHKHKKMLGGMFEEGDDETSKRRRVQDANDRRDERVRVRAATATSTTTTPVARRGRRCCCSQGADGDARSAGG